MTNGCCRPSVGGVTWSVRCGPSSLHISHQLSIPVIVTATWPSILIATLEVKDFFQANKQVTIHQNRWRSNQPIGEVALHKGLSGMLIGKSRALFGAQGMTGEEVILITSHDSVFSSGKQSLSNNLFAWERLMRAPSTDQGWNLCQETILWRRSTFFS